jgi:hypothetical protein
MSGNAMAENKNNGTSDGGLKGKYVEKKKL